MLTFFTAPKPFKGNISVIQRNALESWKLVDPDCQIILFGSEYGIENVVSEYGLSHIPEIKKNSYGTPLLDYIFSEAQIISKNEIMIYVNSDIIFFKDLFYTIDKVPFKKFVLCGQRHDLKIDYLLSFNPSNIDVFRRFAIQEARINTPSGMDYFVFPKGQIDNIPPFTIGRKGWDNWFIYNARKNKIPVIDCSNSIFAVHQDHDYLHVPNQLGNKYEGPESKQNLDLIKSDRLYTWEIEDANWEMFDNVITKKKVSPREIFRQLILHTPQKLHFVAEYFLIIRHYLLQFFIL
jgi:hypothetical protein